MESIKKIAKVVIIAAIVLLCGIVLIAAVRIFMYGILALGCIVYGNEIPAFVLFY